MVVNIDFSQEIFAIDMSRALKSSLKHRRKHVLRPLNYMETRLKGQLQRFDKLSLSEKLRHVENGFDINF